MTEMDMSFWKGKKVFLTGHTGFKGSWLCRILSEAGAQVTGYALPPPTSPSLFELVRGDMHMDSFTGDIRNLETLQSVFMRAEPEIVFHLAAQPIVRESYKNPVHTYETNVMGTVNILECVRQYGKTKSFLNVTTDKVYHNNEWAWGYRETDPLDGVDPYSNSKSCSEMVTHSYRSAYFSDAITAISTARAGNVIGGGDFAIDRIIPDCVRAVEKGEVIVVRNPHSIRPYQHVLEPLFAYLLIASKQYKEKEIAGWYNVGPDDSDCITTGKLTDCFCSLWGEGASWENQAADGPHEANFLKLDCSLIKSVMDWQPRWNIKTAIGKTIEWSKAYLQGENVCGIMDRQIKEYIDGGEGPHV